MRRYTLLYIVIACFLSVNAQKAGDTVSPASQKAGDIVTVTARQTDAFFYAEEIPDKVFARMLGKSFPKGKCLIKRSDLRYLHLLHRNKDGKTQVGEMVCNKAIAQDLLHIFRKLYDANYKIERMILIDSYDADDERSMEANNTTCFNYRMMTGSKTRLSKHGMGMAVDINPLFNPYVKGNIVQPANARKYARNPQIQRGDIVHRLFLERGFKWGGAWSKIKDYQHFEK